MSDCVGLNPKFVNPTLPPVGLNLNPALLAAAAGRQTLAERAAWAAAARHGLDLVTINPVYVMGPVVSARADATSVLAMKAGAPSWSWPSWPWQTDRQTDTIRRKAQQRQSR
jgi:hypothetical protein